LVGILDLVRERGINPGRQKAVTKGGEWQMPCPRCGGRDRFHAWPNQGQGGTWWCRGCDKGGDLIEFLRHVEGLGFGEACRRLGLERAKEYRPDPTRQAPRTAPPAAYHGTARELPPGVWQERAGKLVAAAHEALLGHKPVLAWLARRGVDYGCVWDFQLGWLPGERGKPGLWRARAAWGLPPVERRRDGRTVMSDKLWLPRGLVIPTLQGPASKEQAVVAMRLRRPEADTQAGGAKYYVAPGSAPRPLAIDARWSGGARVWVIVESQLDALMLAVQCGSLRGERDGLPVGVAAVLSATGRPDPGLHQRLLSADRILVALDYDEAGHKGALWWEATYARARRWPVPEGKDPGEYYARGGNIYAWIKEGLPAGLQ
jgi:hypothetical protein